MSWPNWAFAIDRSARRSWRSVQEPAREHFGTCLINVGLWRHFQAHIHISDVARATVAAVESDITGTFNVVDDGPAPVAEWLPELAKAVGAKPPFRIPAFLARLILPEHLFVMMTDVRGGSNAKFKRTFNWRPEFSTWRDGFRRGLGRFDRERLHEAIQDGSSMPE